MANPHSLIPGEAAKKRGKQKIGVVLLFLYMTHATTPKIVAALLNIRLSNVYSLLRRMANIGLVKKVMLAETMFRQPVSVTILAPLGRDEAMKLKPGRRHSYECDRDSVRAGQVDHDMKVAYLAARWVQSGAELLQTDYTQRRTEKYRKLVDAMLRFESTTFALEYERTVKSKLSTADALRAAMKLGVRVLWVCEFDESLNLITECLASDAWPVWKVGTDNKKHVVGSHYVSPWASSRLIAVRADDPLLLVPLPVLLGWMAAQEQSSQLMAMKTIVDDQWGWDWDTMYYNDEEERYWWLLRAGDDTADYCCFHVSSADGKEWVMRYDDMFRDQTLVALPKLSAPPPQDEAAVAPELVHAAIWLAKTKGLVRPSR
ncbi:MAG: hypothetical protein KF892_10085 [Rhizobacter sp.]|nr:hypothetical protein [Rhizobacter sp.]